MSRCLQGCGPSVPLCRDESFLGSLSFWKLLVILGMPWLVAARFQPLIPSSHCLLLQCVSSPLLVRTPFIGCRSHFNLAWCQRSLITSAKTLSPKKVTPTGFRVRAWMCVFWIHNSAHCSWILHAECFREFDNIIFFNEFSLFFFHNHFPDALLYSLWSVIFFLVEQKLSSLKCEYSFCMIILLINLKSLVLYATGPHWELGIASSIF